MMQRILPTLTFSLLLVLSACKKDTAVQYSIRGKVTDADNGSALSGVAIEIEKQVVQNGIYGNTYQNALSTSSDANGDFSGSWPRENFAALRLLAEKTNYILAERSLDVDAFSSGNVTENVALYKEAFASLRFYHSGGNANDRLSFTFLNANFKCNCCSNGWRTWQSAAIDTTVTCRVYGNRWLKYQVQTQIGSADTSYVDSLYCNAFVTTTRDIQY
jgi:hypothetical protein